MVWLYLLCIGLSLHLYTMCQFQCFIYTAILSTVHLNKSASSLALLIFIQFIVSKKTCWADNLTLITAEQFKMKLVNDVI